MAEPVQKRALLIAGPTASGKSALALRRAREAGGHIINADALQVYGELRLLSARPTALEERLAPHRLYGHVSGRESYSVGRWLAEATAALHEAWAAGALPIVAGGTGLYFRALERGLAGVPPIPAEIRQHWREFAGDLHGELEKRDASGAARLNPADRQRLVRALEVIEATGKPLRHWQQQAQSQAALAGVAVERVFVEVPRDDLYARAEARFDAMMAAGALEEVRPLVDCDPTLPMMKAIGVPELLRHLRGEIALADAVALAKAATRHYIKRQFTWWRGQGRHWQEEAIS
jgi:tRNA dimethylallyltransferase